MSVHQDRAVWVSGKRTVKVIISRVGLNVVSDV